MYLAQGFCLFALIVFVEGALPRYKTNAPPRNARIKWNEVDGECCLLILRARPHARIVGQKEFASFCFRISVACLVRV